MKKVITCISLIVTIILGVIFYPQIYWHIFLEQNHRDIASASISVQEQFVEASARVQCAQFFKLSKENPQAALASKFYFLAEPQIEDKTSLTFEAVRLLYPSDDYETAIYQKVYQYNRSSLDSLISLRKDLGIESNDDIPGIVLVIKFWPESEDPVYSDVGSIMKDRLAFLGYKRSKIISVSPEVIIMFIPDIFSIDQIDERLLENDSNISFHEVDMDAQKALDDYIEENSKINNLSSYVPDGRILVQQVEVDSMGNEFHKNGSFCMKI